MRRSCAIALLSAWPPLAEAHGITWPLVALFFSPLVAACLSLLYGFVAKRWKIGLGSFGLVWLLVLWFWLASAYTTSDFLVWIPVVLLEAQLMALVVLLVWLAIGHRSRRRDA